MYLETIISQKKKGSCFAVKVKSKAANNKKILKRKKEERREKKKPMTNITVIQSKICQKSKDHFILIKDIIPNEDA